MGYVLPVSMLQSQYYSNYDRLSETKQDPFHIQPVRKTFNSLLKKEIETPEQTYQESIRTFKHSSTPNRNALGSIKQNTVAMEMAGQYINEYI
ncbi:hypothetical protein [Heyndrickxia acidicola]|uniref:Uncharacterized protein n=1 Tax=Heyndrickxia acidicola TaxID=209389 RepID=A0ABU6MD07_9BACI|nr:hypothetical protein [Heyndrickxia acidicola]MED1202546.1 hypothetical protein [Heyndrickxia acidicola]